MCEVKFNFYKEKMKDENWFGYEIRKNDLVWGVDNKFDLKRNIFWLFGWDNFWKWISK